MPGKVETYLLERINREGAVHMTLIDPETWGAKECAEAALKAEEAGTAAVMVGGSTLYSASALDDAVRRIKASVKAPVILFPNNISGVSRYADALWFMSLLNSSNPYYIIDVQALAARLVRHYGLEALPLGYIIVGEGGAAGYVGQARPIPDDHPEIAVGYSLAAETLGMRFVYLEAGSGARHPVPNDMIRMVRRHLTVPLIVGGGIRDAAAAAEAASAGANIIVTGTLVEETDRVGERVKEIVAGISAAKR